MKLLVLSFMSMLAACLTTLAFGQGASGEQVVTSTERELTLPTDPYEIFQSSLSAVRLKPLRAGAAQPDALHLFFKRSLDVRFAIAELKTDRSSAVRLSFVEPPRNGNRIQHRILNKSRNQKIHIFNEFVDLQAEGKAAEDKVVCIDGPEWYFVMRRNGQLTSGRVLTCGVENFETFGCTLLSGVPCASTNRLWIN